MPGRKRMILRSGSVGRGQFLAQAALTIVGAPFVMSEVANPQTNEVNLTPSRSEHTPYASVKQIDAGVLNVGYVELGPPSGQAVILLHGWPYDIYSYVDVAPALASGGYHVIVPYLRGYGTTKFLSSTTFRNAEQAAVALDVTALMDALKIHRAVIAGFDWGSRTAAIVAALMPERCKAIVAVSGYLITNVKAQEQPLPPQAELAWWYQYYFATERGLLGYSKYRNEFNRLIWKTVSPKWNFSDATYDRTAASFANPDHVAIVIHNYRWRIGLAKGEAEYADLENRLFKEPAISVPAITIASDFDGSLKDGSAYRSKFTGAYQHRTLNGIGHDVPQEAPQAFTKAVIDADHLA